MVDSTKQNQNAQQPETMIYRPISTLWTWIRVILVGYVIGEWIVIGSNLFFLMPFLRNTQAALALEESETWDLPAIQEAIGHFDVAQALFAIVSLGFLCLSMILIGVWIYRSHKNARALGVDGLTNSPA